MTDSPQKDTLSVPDALTSICRAITESVSIASDNESLLLRHVLTQRADLAEQLLHRSPELNPVCCRGLAFAIAAWLDDGEMLDLLEASASSFRARAAGRLVKSLH